MAARSASRPPAVSARPRTPSVTWSWSTRRRGRSGWILSGSELVPPACSTTCSCSGPRWRPAATRVPTTSPWTDMGKFEYAPAPESRAIVSLRESYGLFIGGEFTSGVDSRPFKTISPATEEVLAEVTEAGPADVDRAVTAARSAYEHTWSLM